MPYTLGFNWKCQGVRTLLFFLNVELVDLHDHTSPLSLLDQARNSDQTLKLVIRI